MKATPANLEYPFDSNPDLGTAREVAPGVYWLQMPLPMSLDHINLYLLEDTHGWVLIDTGIRGEETRDLWRRLFDSHLGGKPITKILCTHMHPDHTGQAGFISDYFKATLYMSHGEYYQTLALHAMVRSGTSWFTADYFLKTGLSEYTLEKMRKSREDFTPVEDDKPFPTSFIRVSDGDEIIIGSNKWQVIVGTGHSPEHVCLYSDKLRVLFSGDQILPIITSNVSVFPAEPEGDPLSGWMRSHEKFMQLVPNNTLILPAHNLPFYGLHERLRELIEHHEDRMLSLEEACVSPHTAMDLLPILFKRELDGHSQFMALGECVAHLHCLMKNKRIERQVRADDGVYTYFSIDPSLPSRSTPGEHEEPDDSPLMV